jgi:TM2 domain-containing membrane protein YozV
MFCRNCGKELAGTPEICPGCGAKPLVGSSFCHACGAKTNPLAVICVKCGAKLEGKIAAGDVSPKSRLVVTLLAWFLGGFGVHRFYLGKIGTGILMLLTGGGLGIWTLIDFIFAVTGNMRDKEGKLIQDWQA